MRRVLIALDVQVHATGRYNFNSLLEILKYDYDLPLVHSKQSNRKTNQLSPSVLIGSPRCSL